MSHVLAARLTYLHLVHLCVFPGFADDVAVAPVAQGRFFLVIDATKNTSEFEGSVTTLG